MSLLVAILGCALFVLPSVLATATSTLSISELPDGLRSAFAEWWTSGSSTPTPAMNSVVEFWRVFHVVKLILAAMLLVMLVHSVRWLMSATIGSTRASRRVSAALGGVAAAAFTPFVLVVLMANVQGAAAPLSSVMSMIPLDGSVSAVDDIRQHFATGTTTPVLDALVRDFALYHLVLAACGITTIAAIAAADIMVWVSLSTTSRDQRGRRTTFGVLAIALLAALPPLTVVTLANLSTVAEAPMALRDFFTGGGL